MELTASSALTDGVPSAATVIAPLNVSNLPRTLLTIRWRTEKLIDEWTGSIAHVAVLSWLVAVAVMFTSSFSEVPACPTLRTVNRTTVRFYSRGVQV